MALEEHPGSWTYDPDAGATYFYLHGPIPDGGVARMVPVDAMVNLDLDADGRVIGIEILATWPQTPAASREPAGKPNAGYAGTSAVSKRPKASGCARMATADPTPSGKPRSTGSTSPAGRSPESSRTVSGSSACGAASASPCSRSPRATTEVTAVTQTGAAGQLFGFVVERLDEQQLQAQFLVHQVVERVHDRPPRAGGRFTVPGRRQM
ncbi:hypothetical protein GCM10017600_68870 [Streptosporangium carneum]|uniref:DUF2283 domain-containing protein n=1 Tax=Streptosporangium carneum TaxID=47481 RepID=A0A9W6I8R0_9ACTN|nr:hypothetical protein GCM10017600_68870 [Streptosporangium carneum]